jgi:hypothetical protein
MKHCTTVVTGHVHGSGLVPLRENVLLKVKQRLEKNSEKRAGADGARTAKENGLSSPRYLKKRFKQKNSLQPNSPNTTL